MKSEHMFRLLVARLCGADVELPPQLDSNTLALVKQHQLAPLVYRLGYGAKTGFIKNAILAELRETILREVNNVLSKAGIRACLLKGIAYSHNLYADPAERPMGDIDLMIPPQDFAQATHLIWQLGFIPRAGKYAHLARTHHALTLNRGNVTLDLHRSITQPWRSRIDISAIWERMVPAFDRGDNLFYLEATDAIVLHCAHIARHELMAGALNYIDLAKLERQSAAPRHTTLARAKSFRLGRSIQAVLRTADNIRRMKRAMPSILPNSDQILRNLPMSRPRQLAAKAFLVEGPAELLGLVGVGAYERWFPHSRWE